jgi:iron complex outermembrane receptor protein
MKKIYLAIIGLFVALATQGFYAQKLYIIDQNTLSPIKGAQVFDCSGKTKNALNQTGVDGYVTMKEYLDCYLLSATGYETKTVSSEEIKANSGQFSLIPFNQLMKEVEVTSNSSSKNKLEIPVSIATISPTEIKRGIGLFMDDAINTNIPGVYMQRRTVSAGQNFNIRGYGNGVRGTNGASSNFDGQGSKVYLNGIPITDAEGITLMDDIDFGSIGNVEIQKGPSGSLYGLAIAGVVNLTTSKAQEGTTSVGQDVLIGSYGLKRFTSRFEMATGKSSLMVNYGHQLYDGFMQHTNSRKDFVNVFGTYNASAKQSLSYYAGYSNSYDARNGELTKGQYDTMDYSGNTAYIKNNAHSNVVSARMGLTHTYAFNKAISNATTIYVAGLNSNVSSAGGWTDKAPVNFGLRSTFDVRVDLNKNFKLSGITGIEAQRQNAQTIGYGMVKDSFATVSTAYNIIGAMKSNTFTTSSTYSYFTEWTLKMPYSFSLTAGLGISNMSITLNDRFYVSSNNNPSNPNGTHKPMVYDTSYNFLASPRIALNKVFKEKVSIYTSLSRGYKAPVSSYFYIPVTGDLNTNLKPEVGTQIEIGSKGALMKKRLSYELALFQSVYDNKMTVVAVPNAANTATSYTYVANGGRQVNLGAEAMVKFELMKDKNGVISSFVPFINGAYSNFVYRDFKFQQLNAAKTGSVEVDYSNKKVAGVPPITFNAGFDLTTKFGVYANYTYSYRDGVYYTSDNADKANSFGLMNAKVGYRKVFFQHLSVDAYFGINNITSQKYYVMLFVNQTPDVYIPGPNNRNYFGGINLKYQF